MDLPALKTGNKKARDYGSQAGRSTLLRLFLFIEQNDGT